MTWFKVDDRLAFNAKVMLAGNAAMGLWVRAGSWSSSQLTDGFIPEHMANAMANACDCDALVMAGLWNRIDGGYQFHDWEDFQPTAESERVKTQNRSNAGKRGAMARWGISDDGKSHGKSYGKSDGKSMAKECPDPTRPDPIKESGKKTPLPEDWAPTDEHRKRASEYKLDVEWEARKFKDHAYEKDRRSARWNAAFTTWLNKARDWSPKQSGEPDLWDKEGDF